MSNLTPYFPQFFTATILEWNQLLKNDKYKEIITSSLRFLVQNKRVIIYGFVIMPNHIHLVWQIYQGHKRENVQRDFLKFTAQQLKFMLQNNEPSLLNTFKVITSDRMYQIWERNPLSVDLYNTAVLKQKLHYIHQNPLQEKWQLVADPQNYRFSSAAFYETGKSEWDFLTHYLG